MDAADDAVERHYDALADHWADIVDSPGRKHILWPAMADLLPDVDGLRVLDAGSGDGHYAALLADQGAEVVGIDSSEQMVQVARDRYGETVRFERADLADPLPFDDESFDLLLCQHVFSHLPDIETPIQEFARVLRPGGTLVLSTHHPLRDYLVVRERAHPAGENTGFDLDPHIAVDHEAPTYLDTERFEIHWHGEGSDAPGVYYRRSVSDIVQPILDAGFSLADLVEPGPDDTLATEAPDFADAFSDWPPGALCVRAVR